MREELLRREAGRPGAPIAIRPVEGRGPRPTVRTTAPRRLRGAVTAAPPGATIRRCASSTPRVPSARTTTTTFRPSTAWTRRVARPGPRRTVLRAPRPPPDRQDVGAARVARPAERRRRLPVRIRQRGSRPSDARGRGGRHARCLVRAGARSKRDAERRDAGGHLARRAGTGGAWPGAASGAAALVHGRRAAAGAADRRDRRAGGRHSAVGAAAAPRRLPGPPGPFPAERSPVRGAGCARLPHPLHRAERPRARRERLQRQVEVAPPGRLHRGRDAGPAHPAHGGDRAGVHRGGA